MFYSRHGWRVIWETTNLPFHASGDKRRTGRFATGSLLRAWLWGLWFCFVNPRGAVTIEKIT